MKNITAVSNKVLLIDLSKDEIRTLDVPEKTRRDYIGGKGLALKLLHDNIKPGIEALSGDNMLVFATGPTAGTAAPAGNRFVIASKSPLTGIFACSYVGGRFGLSLKKAGFDGLIVTGNSQKPINIHINDDKITFEDAADDWGLDTYDFQEKHVDAGEWVVIGPAGENLVKYSVIASKKRVAGRCGLGAVMGSKNIKGISATGSLKVKPTDPAGFKKSLRIAQKKVLSHDNSGRRLKELGTAQNVRIYGSSNIMPVRNFSKPSFDKLEDISAEKIRDNHTIKSAGCTGCPIKCGKVGNYNGKKLVTPEYETIAIMGANLLISDISKIALWNDKLNRLGLDSISTGVSIGFVAELAEKGMVESDITFGNPEVIERSIEDIAYRRGLGDDMAEGVKRLSEKYGGKDFACHVKGLEMAGYDPRGCHGQGLGYATANCGATHLSGSTHSVEVDPMGGKPYIPAHGSRAKAEFVIFLQNLMDMTNASIFCLQTQYPFLEENPLYKILPKFLLRFLSSYIPKFTVNTADLSDYASLLTGLLGCKITQKDLRDVGERIFNLERHMNCEEGISRKDDALPSLMTSETDEAGWEAVDLDAMLARYYKLRGWDDNGIPKKETLTRLGITT